MVERARLESEYTGNRIGGSNPPLSAISLFKSHENSLGPETATRVRQRIEDVWNAAKLRGYVSGDNPARWKGHLDLVLPAPAKIRPVKHHDAMPYKDVPVFVSRLRASSSLSTIALEFLILTACRTSEVRLAVWDEIDLENRVWTIPKERMKAGS